MSSKVYYVLAYYKFVSVTNPHQLVNQHHAFFKGRDATARIYISEQGINGQMSAEKNDAEAYMSWLRSLPEFEDIEFKIHTHHENVFPRVTVKYRKQLVAFDVDVDMSLIGEHISSNKWREMLQHEQNKIVIDVRNEYEWKVGHFEGSELPSCDLFRDFPAYTQRLKENIDPKNTKVMMCCTGGIRCEIYSAYLKQQGFDHVYQLQGGIIKYGLEQKDPEQDDLWKGKLFVFDDRLTVPIHGNMEQEDKHAVIGECLHCKEACDLYYNCANAACNQLFICCPECVKQFMGCCCEECSSSPKLRAYQQQGPHKPFRRKHLYREHT
ncbi:MAG: hypothetical protein K0S74_270 [Chlamydiales bacterium]|jgi:UPF0176 protein|nr:hypothetical protein [Chlamydiales bacterium]